MDFLKRFQKKEKNPPIMDVLMKEGFLENKNIKEIRFLMENTELEMEDILFRFISKERLLLAKGLLHNHQFPTIDLLENIDKLDMEIFNLLSQEDAHKFRAVCICKKDEKLEVAMDDPSHQETVALIESQTGITVGTRYITVMDDINKIFKKIEQKKILDQKKKMEPVSGQNGNGNGSEEEEVAYTKPVEELDVMTIEEFTLGGDEREGVKGVRPIVDAIIKQGLKREASDIHIEPTRKFMQVRYRIDGILTPDPLIDNMLKQGGSDKRLHENIVNVIKNRSGEAGKTMRLDETEKAQDGRIYIPEVDLDLRVSVVPTIMGESVVIRIHYREIGMFTLDRLGFEPKVYEKLRKLIEVPYGMFLISGPTGSGKTTTLYSIMNIINNPSKKALTVEDPVEYSIPGANQSQINQNKGFTFDAALRSFLRHDPDIIMVGEIRDVQTAQMAMEAALTGHLVLSSIHANDAVTTVTRLKDLGVDPRLVTATCIATLGQRLVRRVCNDCKRPHIFSTKLYNAFDSYGIKYNPRKLVKGVGCKKCSNTGYHGRIGVFELLTLTYEIKEMILKDEPEEKIFEMAKKQGMRTLLEDVLTKVSRGMTTEEEVWRVTLLEGTYE